MHNDYTHYLKGIKYLDVINLEEKLSSVESTKIHNNIFIDLSQCLFAELGALAKLLLIIESYLKQKANIFIALPTARNTVNENRAKNTAHGNKKPLIEGLVNKRRDVNSFLKRTGFVSAVQEIGKIYKQNILITELFDFEKGELNIASFEESFSVVYEEHIANQNGYKFLFPFKWIDCGNGIDEIESFEAELDHILKNEDRGLDSIDVKSIKNVVLSELIKNVHEHSKSKYAIFTIGLINSISLTRSNRDKKQNTVEKSYISWIEENNISSQVEMYFGDSGIGILNKEYEEYIKVVTKNSGLSKNDQLQSAFQKWTTLKAGELRRGTKGLYRLHRIVKKYNGLVHIDCLGYDGGFFKDLPVFRKSKFHLCGTLVSIKLNPYKEISAFRYTIDEPNQLQEKWVSDKFEINETFVYETSIKKYIQDYKNVLLLLDITAKNLAIELDRKELENLFYEISRDAEPTRVVICLINRDAKIANDTIDILIDSVHTRISEMHAGSVFPEIETAESEEILDPVLVIGDANRAFWYGGTKELVDILDACYLQGPSYNVKSLESFTSLNERTQSQIILYLRSSSTLINIDSQFRLLFNFYGVEKHYEQTIANAFRSNEKQQVCTPKLHIVEKWVSIGEVLSKDEYGFALCLYLKYRNFIQDENEAEPEIDRDNTFILIDSSQQYELAKKFVDLLGIRTKNIRDIESDIDFNIPKRTKLFPKNSSVILLTTVISSSETIRRLVKYAKRDFAKPLAVLCLANFRKYNISHLETWSDTTKILSCFQKNLEDSSRIERDDKYFKDKKEGLLKASRIINPSMYFDEDPESTDIISIDKKLLEFLSSKKLLHYNHYGVYNKRHFTFFLNKSGIINAESFIWEKFATSIDRWVTGVKTSSHTIYVNESFIGGNNAFHNFLKSRYGNNNVRILDKKVKSINSPNVVFLDFGILTGDSVNNFISKCYSVDNLFICLLFNQAINSNADIFQKIDQLRYHKVLTNEYGSTKFKIDYLFHLPLNFFNSENCPICEHRRALDFFKIDHEYLFKFSEDRQERLKQNLSDELMEISYPVDFYYSKKAKKQELSIKIIMQMYELKILLENAKKLTRCRIELYNMVFDLFQNIEEEVQNSDSRIYSLIYYLSHEINWFQQEPLIFRDFRILISKISSKIAKLSIDDLVHFFTKTNSYDIENKNLATRYKYSAISVLRSTDKLIFCQEIFDIISSFTKEGRSSDNLLQNCLYHISSLFKNSYNKSELYYIEIANNLRRVVRELKLTKEQNSAIENILEENAKTRGRAILVGAEPRSFREMKQSWEDIYKVQMPRHPFPYEEYKALSISQHKELFEIYFQNKLSQEEAKTLKEITKNLKDHWENVKNYIDNNIIYSFVEHLPMLTTSGYFKDKFSNYINVSKYKANADKFNQILEEINCSLDTYIKKEEEYENLFNYFLQNYIQVKGLSNFTEDAKILNLLSDFPSNINRLVDKVFSREKFPKRNVVLNYNSSEIVSSEGENILVYFPSSMLQWHFERVLQNIKDKRNQGVELADIDIEFNISISQAHMVNLIISYDQTDEFKSHESEDGSLNNLKKLIEEFGGQFSFILPDGNSKRFIINMKLMRYE
ncbi:MAG: hypothetical protein ACTHMM_03585 [Agriterribacter sp.]